MGPLTSEAVADSDSVAFPLDPFPLAGLPCLVSVEEDMPSPDASWCVRVGWCDSEFLLSCHHQYISLERDGQSLERVGSMVHFFF